MKRSLLASAFAIGVLAAVPAMAQQAQQSQQTHKEAVPFQVDSKTVMQIQEKLNKMGFNAGHADGNWGPETQAAVKNFQEKKGLQATGDLDQKTLAELGVNMTSGSGSSGSSQMSQQQAEQMLQKQGYSQIQLKEDNGKFDGTAMKGGKQYQVDVSQSGQVTEHQKQ